MLLSRWLAVGLLLATGVTAQATTNSSCAADCQVLMPYAEVWLWTPNWNWMEFAWHSDVVTATSTVITVINTVLDTTSTVTSYPSGYTPPPTNEAGTRVETITYTRSLKATTTVIAFPTPFVAWPDFYGWKGTLNATQGSTKQCLTATPDAASEYGPTTAITANPQPTSGRTWAQDIPENDTQGFFYDFVPAGMDQTIFEDPEEVSLFPGEQAINLCRPGGAGPNLGAFTATHWTVMGTTSYDNSPAKTSKVDVSTAPQSTASPSLSTSQPATTASSKAESSRTSPDAKSTAASDDESGSSGQEKESQTNNPGVTTSLAGISIEGASGGKSGLTGPSTSMPFYGSASHMSIITAYSTSSSEQKSDASFAGNSGQHESSSPSKGEQSGAPDEGPNPTSTIVTTTDTAGSSVVRTIAVSLPSASKPRSTVITTTDAAGSTVVDTIAVPAPSEPRSGSILVTTTDSAGSSVVKTIPVTTQSVSTIVRTTTNAEGATVTSTFVVSASQSNSSPSASSTLQSAAAVKGSSLRIPLLLVAALAAL